MQYVYDGIEIHRGWEDALNKDTVQQSKLSPAYNLQNYASPWAHARFIQVHPGSSRFIQVPGPSLYSSSFVYPKIVLYIHSKRERDIYIYIYLVIYIYTPPSR